MKLRIYVCLMGLWLCAAYATPVLADEVLRLAADGISPYQVVVAKDAGNQVWSAADEFVIHFEKITSVKLAVVTDDQPATDHEIVIGLSNRLDTLDIKINWQELDDEGYRITTKGNHLIIVGGPKRGVLHGVWGFLEKELGCRWYAPKFSVIPKDKNLTITAPNRIFVPAFETRSLWSYNADASGQPVWSARMHLNCFVRHMRKDRFYKGQIGWDEFISHPLLDGAMYWAEHSSHTFGRLVPVSTYYETHPEYYSLVDGKRIRKEGQLCMTNADVADITSQWAIDRLNQDPKARLVSISQGDWGGFCQCESCNTSRQQYEDIRGYSLNYSSALVPFVSKVAQKVSATHPDALVTTLAYQFTRIASTDMKIPDNMVVRYCPIEVCALHAMDDTAKCPWHQKNYEGTSFVNELKTWLKVSPNVWIWYYAHNRGGSLQPSPFLGTASRNIKMFQRMGVKGVQVQSIISPTRWYSPFEDLKSYIMAKLTWEPDYNVKQGVTEFCNAYYGPAAPIIDRYVWALHDDDIYADSTAAFLARLPGTHMLHGQITPIKTEYLHEFDAWFDAAEKKVADDPTLLHRVRVVRMTLQYSLMVHGKRDDPIREKAIAAFFPFAEKIGITDENYEEQHGLRDTATDKVVSLSEFKKIMKNR